MNESFIYPLNGLKAGRSTEKLHAGEEFFQSFGSTEILDADLSVDVSIEQSGDFIGVDLDIKGWVEVICDRCLGRLRLPVETSPSLSVKFGEQDDADDLREGEREIVILPESDTDLDLSQVVYDYVCISLPLKRVHASGGCDPDTVKYLGAGEQQTDVDDNNPFAALKGLL